MESADTAVLSLCKDVWMWRISESPELATFCGFYQYDDKWDDISEEAYVRREGKVREFMKVAETLDTKDCSPDVILSLKLLVSDMKTYINGVFYKSYLMPLNYLEGIHTDCNLTVSCMKFEGEKDFHNLKARLEKLPSRVESVILMSKKGVEQGIVTSRHSVQDIPGQIDIILASKVEDWGLMTPFKENKCGLDPEVFQKLKTQCCDIIQSSIVPAFNSLKTFITEDYMKHVRPKDGVNSLQNGDEWYKQCLNFHLTCSMTPQEVHDLGLKEVARINSQIVALAKKEGLPETMPELLEAIEKKQANSFKSQGEVLKYVQDLCFKKIRPKLSKYFKELPDIQMKIQLKPAYFSSAPAGYYLNGTPDGSRDGSYFINANNLDSCLPYAFPALSLHEGEPGHHLQGIYSLAATHLPDFRRYLEDSKYYLAPSKFSFNTGYLEGWGLYCEALGEEMGIYSDNMEMLGRYNMEIFRAARLVVDTGIHAFGWSREKAVEYMNTHTLENRKTIEGEIQRYITWPGQACAYKVGEIKIWELRRNAEEKLGPKFDIKEFHHCILSCGAVPLSVLEEIVDAHIEDTAAKVLTANQ